jgi:LysR family transcriptional regulator (chromosome initiation inhibitor)
MELDQLRTFAAVIDNGTFESAARALGVTPSAISQRIKSLENSAGRVLLRRTKPATATESGEVVLRLARQSALLHGEALAALDGTATAWQGIPIVINADSLATWVLPALVEVSAAHAATFEILRDDEEHSIDLLRDGTAMAAVTSVSRAVQGCVVTRLGVMRYRPVASRSFAERWFPDGPTAAALAVAPVVVFDRKDTFQDRYLATRSRTLTPPRQYVPASAEFVAAVGLGLGWGMLPDLQANEGRDRGQLVTFDPVGTLDVPLYLQRWNLRSPVLAAISAAFEAAAAKHLH